MTDEPPTTPGTPRWVKVFGTVALVIILLFVILAVFGGGHGPSRHTALGDSLGEAPTLNVAEEPARYAGGLGRHASSEGSRG